MKRLIISILAILAISIGASAQRLTMLHVNDTHSHLDPLRNGEAGVIERAAIIDSIRLADGKKNVLLLHAGDFDQGTSYYTVLQGELEANLVNALGYDCITLGNHEFDSGAEHLAARLKKIKCPVVCANYDFSESKLKNLVKPYTIIKKAGKKIGIIGLLCDISKVTANYIENGLKALDTVEECNRWADFLKNEAGCDLVIALTHIGYEANEGVISDITLVPQTRNVDLVVGGHSHTQLKKPTIVKNLDGRDIPVVQDWCWGYNIGIMHIDF